MITDGNMIVLGFSVVWSTALALFLATVINKGAAFDAETRQRIDALEASAATCQQPEGP